MGLSHYHPMNAHFAFYATAYSVRSVATTGFVLAWDIRNDTAAELRALALGCAETIRLRKYTVAGDFWWLTPQTLDATVWAAWQVHVPTAQSGAALFFRRAGATGNSMAAGLRGVGGAWCFAVQLYDESYALVSDTVMTGLELRDFKVVLDSPGTSALLEYTRITRPC